MGLEYYWKLFRKSWKLTFWGRHVTFGFWVKIVNDQVVKESHKAPLDQNTYQYSLLQHSSHFRIFELEPGERHDPIRGRIHNQVGVQYEALSYVWGSQQDKYPIEIEGHAFGITKNLYTALEHLRYPDRSRILWIDAICINQQDLEERSMQVTRMLEIYAQAKHVNVWLGPAKGESSCGMQILSYLAQDSLIDQAPWILTPEQPFHEGLREIMERQWFSRMWVVQEAAVSQRAIMICGEDKFPWKNDPLQVRRLVRRLKYAVISPQWEQAGLSKVNMSPLLQVLNLQIQHIERTRQESFNWSADILDVVYEMRYRSVADPRDKLYAILGMVDPDTGKALTPDYNLNVEGVFQRLLKVIEI